MTPRVRFGLVGAIIVALACVCFADTGERVAPPQDQNALHLSVVGVSGSAEYGRLLYWFNNDEDLSALRRGTHFHVVAAGSAIFNARYQPNIKALPTVRLQNSEGVVLYEASGSEVPKSADGLCNAIEKKTSQLFNPPILPWRRKIQGKCGPGGCGPQGCPQTQPPQEVTPEDLMLDDYGLDGPPVPDLEEPEPSGVSPALAAILCVLACVGGFVGAIIGSVNREIKS